MGRKGFAVSRAGFTLVELLVVIGIMVILIGILLPSLSRAQQAAKGIKCEAQLHDIGLALLEYADEHNGYLFPTDMGYDAAHVGPVYPDDGSDPNEVYNVWPVRVWGKWNPPELICPADLLPYAQHSYVINSHMGYWNVKYSTELPNHISPSDVVLMGEKITTIYDYYMEYGDFDRVVEKYRHGSQWGSNYLMLDMHVDTKLPAVAEAALDPWDFAAGRTPPTTQQDPGS
jgi:prepilin-type N-terminal cleavage/methylation domain-containing protein